MSSANSTLWKLIGFDDSGYQPVRLYDDDHENVTRDLRTRTFSQASVQSRKRIGRTVQFVLFLSALLVVGALTSSSILLSTNKTTTSWTRNSIENSNTPETDIEDDLDSIDEDSSVLHDEDSGSASETETSQNEFPDSNSFNEQDDASTNEADDIQQIGNSTVLENDSNSEVAAPSLGDKPSTKPIKVQRLGEWEIARLKTYEDVVVSCTYASAISEFRLHITVTIEQEFIDCPTTQEGCVYRIYVKGANEIVGGTYLSVDPKDSHRYQGSVLLHEVGDAKSEVKVEVIRLKSHPYVEGEIMFWQDGYLVTDPNYNSVPIWKAVRRISKRSRKSSTKSAVSDAILSNSQAALKQRWAKAYAKLPNCVFRTNGKPAWKVASWTSAALLQERGLDLSQTVGNQIAEYIWLPRDCKLINPTESQIDKYIKPKRVTVGGTGLYVIGTSRIRNVFERVPYTFHTTTPHPIETTLHTENVDHRHVHKKFEIQKNFDFTLIWGSNNGWETEGILEDIIDSPMVKYCDFKHKRPVKGKSNHKLFIGLSIGVWEVKHFAYYPEEKMFEYFDTLFSTLRQSCGSSAHIFIITQPAVHLYNPSGRIHSHKYIGKALAIDMSASQCTNCAHLTSNIRLAKSQEMATKASKKYNVGFIDFQTMTEPLRYYSKDSLHYKTSISSQMFKTMLLGFIQASSTGLVE